MYLLDTNIFLEYLLGQEKGKDVLDFLNASDTSRIWVTDFSLHSIGVLFTRLNRIHNYQKFIQIDIQANGIGILTLQPDELSVLVNAITTYNLDFDDAYQYSIAQCHNLSIISYDHDFEKTPEGKIEPKQVLMENRDN